MSDADTIAAIKSQTLARISVQKNAGSSASPLWRTWKTGIRARIQPLETTIDSTTETPSTTARYRIFVAENIDVDHTCRIRGADGTIYTILSSTGADRIGELQVIEVESSG
ncbi:MAG: head-tail adaptor protein [Thermoguttaceae bacterium]